MPDSAANEQTIGAYRLEGEIATDSAGVVYRARHIPTAQPVAIRILPPDIVAAPDFRERFEREMRAVAALYHPHIAELYEFGIGEGRAFIIGELPSDGFLRDAIRRRTLPLRLSIELARQAAVGFERSPRPRRRSRGAQARRMCALCRTGRQLPAESRRFLALRV
jgi:serine/threonine protein kinase